MKKTIWVFILSAIFLFLFFNQASAQLCNSGGTGIVPCGQSSSDGSIPCKCEIGHVFLMIGKIYTFIVRNIATPLATLALLIGGMIILISAGDPKWFQIGKNILLTAVIGLVLVFCAWLIVNFILTTLGAPGL
jgi:hypothetical protein